MLKKNKTNWLTLFFMSVIVLTLLIFLLILYLIRVINWNYITGFIVGCISFLAIIPLISLAVKELVRTENVYYYLMLFFMRLPLILIPFLFAIYLKEYFSPIGIIIACIPLVTYFFIKNFTDGKQIIKRKEEV